MSISKVDFKIKVLKLVTVVIILGFSNLYAFENKILFKINNEIITTVDISEEINYLVALNKNISQLDRNKIINIAKNSLIKERLKTIELKKKFQIININEKELSSLIENIYKNIGISNLNDFKKYLNKRNVDIKKVKSKVTIENNWNQMIYQKYYNQIKIDRESIENELRNKKSKSYLISEIVFNAKNKDEFNDKYLNIKKTIKNENFETAAIIHSISDSSQNGGNIGWIKESSFSKAILKKLSEISQGEFTDPTSIPGGFIILKINDLKKEKVKLNLEEEINKTINAKVNAQLSQFSNIYLNKIKNDFLINEK